VIILVNTKVLTQSRTAFGWAINPYNGCSHGCKYCYGMPTCHTEYSTWLHARPRDNLIEKLLKDIETLRRIDWLGDIQDIFLGAITDAYQPLEAKYKQTQKVIEVLEQNELPFTIITKNDLVLRDIDLLKDYRWCRVGVTITSLDENLRKELEPYTASYENRINVLKQLKQAGIQTYLSCEPIMPAKECNPLEIARALKDYVDLFDFGKYTRHHIHDETPYNYYRDYYNNQFYIDAFSTVIKYCNENQINYCISAHSKKFFKDNGLVFKPYPLLKPITPRAETTEDNLHFMIEDKAQTTLLQYYN
jgi:DNA repair photolyase